MSTSVSPSSMVLTPASGDARRHPRYIRTGSRDEERLDRLAARLEDQPQRCVSATVTLNRPGVSGDSGVSLHSLAARRSLYAARRQACEHQIGGRPIGFFCTSWPQRRHVPSAIVRRLLVLVSGFLSALMTPMAFVRTQVAAENGQQKVGPVRRRRGPARIRTDEMTLPEMHEVCRRATSSLRWGMRIGGWSLGDVH